MNVHSRIQPDDAGYDLDFYRWSNEQAALIRTGRWDTLDAANIAEEIESLGKSQRSALASQIGRVIEHLLKLQRSPARPPRRGWLRSIVQARAKIAKLLAGNPSLRPQLTELVAEENDSVRRTVVRTLELYGELDAARAILADTEPFTVDQVVGDWFPFEATR